MRTTARCCLRCSSPETSISASSDASTIAVVHMPIRNAATTSTAKLWPRPNMTSDAGESERTERGDDASRAEVGGDGERVTGNRAGRDRDQYPARVRIAQAEVGTERLVRTFGQEDAELVEEARRQQRDDKRGGKPGNTSSSVVGDPGHRHQCRCAPMLFPTATPTLRGPPCAMLRTCPGGTFPMRAMPVPTNSSRSAATSSRRRCSTRIAAACSRCVCGRCSAGGRPILGRSCRSTACTSAGRCDDRSRGSRSASTPHSSR